MNAGTGFGPQFFDGLFKNRPAIFVQQTSTQVAAQNRAQPNLFELCKRFRKFAER